MSSRRVRALSFLVLPLLAPPAAALPAPPVSLVEIRPEVDGKLVTLPLAAGSSADAMTTQVSIDLVLQNTGPALTFDHAHLTFSGGPAVAPVDLDAAVRRTCGGSSVTMAEDPVFPAGGTCRFVLLPDLRLPYPAPTGITIEMHFDGFAPLVVARPLAPHKNPTPTGSYRFPARAVDLAPGTYWSGRASHDGSHHRTSQTQMIAYDMGVVRYDAASGDWVATRENPTGSDEDYLVFNQPIYALADGVVEECVDTEPDDGSGSANKFIIRHGDDEYALYAHLREGLSNPLLCQAGALVKEGDYLGRAGRSGTGTPHLHLHVQSGPPTSSGQARPLLFHDAFLVERAGLGAVAPQDMPWAPVRDAGLPWEETILWPSPLLRRGDADGPVVQAIAAAPLASGRFALATRTPAGTLAVDAWSLSSAGQLGALGSNQAGSVSLVAAAPATSGGEFATAVRDSSGNLKVIGWRVEPGGAVTRLGDDSGGGVSDLAVSRLAQGSGVVTAVRTSPGGRLKVIAWRLQNDGQVVRAGDDEGGLVTQPAVAAGSKFKGVVTAARNGLGELELASWEISADAASVVQRDVLTGGPIADVEIARPVTSVLLVLDVFVTASRLADGTLLVQSWRVASDGTLSAGQQATAGAVDDVALSVRGRHVLASTRTAGGDLRTIVWRVDDSGALLRVGEADAGPVHEVAAAGPLGVGGTALMVTAVRTAADALKLIAWQSELQP